MTDTSHHLRAAVGRSVEASSLSRFFGTSKTFAVDEFTTGFDYVRIVLSVCVLLDHCLVIARLDLHNQMWNSYYAPLQLVILPAFFALSGYLVTGSLERNTISRFVALRVIRIFPALFVEVLFCALLIGVAFTKLPLADYFSSPVFHSYFLNMIGYIHYELPGVFDGKAINVQLWTIPFELECYVLLVACKVVGLIRSRKLFLLLIVSFPFAYSLVALMFNLHTSNWNVPGRMLVFSFISGVALYVFRAEVPRNGYLALCAGVATYLSLLNPNTVFLAALPLTYLTMYVGMLDLPRLRFGDLSYGLYLFHFPIALTIYEVSGEAIGFTRLAFGTLVLSGLFSLASWNLVEKPVLSKKKALLAYLPAR